LQHEDFWEIAGLVKPWVLEGGYWRILSAPFLHFSTPYLGIMVPVFGIAFPYIQKIAHPLYLPIVFLLSAVTGNLFSLLIFPNAAFMGPSGGILGIFGFLLTMSLKLESVPKNFTLLILKYIVLLLLAGLTAPLVLDVAVHLGGLLMGMYLGVVLVNDGEPDLPYKASPMVKFLGVVCTIVILGAIGFVALLFLADFVSLQLAL
ncbi:MAG: rhomboid family intramembrane serine protease, partial [Bacteroidota bacterium]